MRYELSDCEWSVIKPMLPNKPRGIPRVDDRRVLSPAVDQARRARAPACLPHQPVDLPEDHRVACHLGRAGVDLRQKIVRQSSIRVSHCPAAEHWDGAGYIPPRRQWRARPI